MQPKTKNKQTKKDRQKDIASRTCVAPGRGHDPSKCLGFNMLGHFKTKNRKFMSLVRVHTDQKKKKKKNSGFPIFFFNTFE